MAPPAVVISKNSAGSVTSTTGTFSSAVAAGTPMLVGICLNSDTPTISSFGPDSKGNVYSLIGHQTTTVGKPIWIYKTYVTTSLTTSDTLAVTISVAAIINFIGVVGPGTVFVPNQFTGGANTGAAAAFQLSVPALPSTANGYMVAFSVNGSAAPTWLTPGPTVLTTISGGGGPFFSCAYEDVDDFPALLEIDMSPTSTASMATSAFMSEYTDLYDGTYSSLYGQFLGTPWPASGPLAISVQLLLNGTWTDITDFVYQRDGSLDIQITSGRPDWSSKVTFAQCQMQLNNRGGTFSPRNTSSPFYPFITKNTQIRVFAPVAYNSTDSGLAFMFSGEVTSWPPSWDPTGSDVWVEISASGPIRRLNQQSAIGSAISRFYTLKDPNDPTSPIAYWPMEDGSNSATLAEVTGNGSPATLASVTGLPTLSSDASFAGSDSIPVLNGGSITCLTGSPIDPGVMTYSTPGTYIFTPRSGLTVLNTVECTGGGGGGTNGYQANTGKDAAGGGGEYAKDINVAVTGGNPYTVIVGVGGAGGALSTGDQLHGVGFSQNRGQPGGLSQFTGDSVTTTAHGGGGGTFTGARIGAGGTGSTSATHHDGAPGGKNVGSLFGGSGGGSAGSSFSAGNVGANGGGSNTGAAGGTSVGGGAGGQGGNGGAGVDDAANAGTSPGGGGGSGGENSTNGAAHSGGNGGSGQVKLTWTPLLTPAYNVTRFLLQIPQGGDTNSSVVARVQSGGKVAKLELVYTTASSGTLTLQGKDSGGATLFTATGITGVNGTPYMASMELTPGSTIGYRFTLVPANSPSTQSSTAGTASASGSISTVSEIDINPDGALTGTAVGHVLLQYTFESFGALSGGGNAGLGPLSGWAQEKVGHRFVRLCTEEGIAFTLIGDVFSGVSTTAQMGPQPDDKLINVLQQIEDIDGGLLVESLSTFGLTYRCRSDMVAQAPMVISDYSLSHISQPFQPVDDDQLIKNDITVSRPNGSSYHVALESGPLSIQDPPNGVGSYTYAITINAFADSQLPAIANRILTQGTTDEFRYPQVSFSLSRPEVQQLFGSLTQIFSGDRIQILNPPSFLMNNTIDLIVIGFTITLNPRRFYITLNCMPASPFNS